MEPLLYHKTLYQKKQDAMAADFIKSKLPYSAKIELRTPKFEQRDDGTGWRAVEVPNYVYGVITAIDHVTVWIEEEGKGKASKISFDIVKKIYPYEKPKD